jgi:alpha-L-rhamnosidase
VFEIGIARSAREEPAMDAIAPEKNASSSSAGPAPRRSWTARMIGPLSDAGVGSQASYLRKIFTVADPTERAELAISALGLYRAFINGRRVGDDQLTPGWTSYQDRLSCQTYDVTDLLRAGDNTIDIWLGDGWYRSQMMWAKNPILNTWGSRLGAIAEIVAGGKIVLATGEGWRSGLLPILKSGIYFGETYDARQEDLPADYGSEPVDGFDPGVLIPHEINGVKELEPLPPVKSFKDGEGRIVYDFAQNSAGYVEFDVEGERGARVIVEHAEILDRGEFSNSNMRSAAVRLEYVLKGGGVEHYKPVFTFQGFRYARVTVEGKAELRSIVSVPITSAIRRTGTISTGHPLVNRLVENTVWSQRSNFIEVPTDCPQRDERLGWTGDAQVFAATACYLHDSHDLLVKWLRDVMADQRPDGEITHVSPDPTRGHEDICPGFYGSTGWGDAITVVPWTLWLHYRDRAILEETFAAMIRWVDFVWSISDGPVVRPPRGWHERGFTFGDWLQPSGPTEKPLPTIGDDAAATIYLYISSLLVAEVAGVLGETATEERMRTRADHVKTAFAHEFITPSGRLVYDDQTSYALAFLHDLIPPDKQAAAKQYFKATIRRADGRIGTGFIGTPALLPALVKIGEPELAASMFLQEGVPGWLYQVKNGATTIWERWDAIKADGSVFDPAMNSYNHYAYGAVCQWLFEAVAGLRPDPQQPGFRHILCEPVIIPELKHVAASFESAAGRIEAGWRFDGDLATYDVTIPAGATATLVLPDRYRNVKIYGFSARLEAAGTKTRSLLAAGRHQVTFRISKP